MKGKKNIPTYFLGQSLEDQIKKAESYTSEHRFEECPKEIIQEASVNPTYSSVTINGTEYSALEFKKEYDLKERASYSELTHRVCLTVKAVFYPGLERYLLFGEEVRKTCDLHYFSDDDFIDEPCPTETREYTTRQVHGPFEVPKEYEELLPRGH